ncbi:hypothetical protein HYV71_00135 [Candidatus Uhrbacteria bacterium]|nr:hypothetical protein [Candidatus Uhrbacteria bacterium]
MPLPKGVKEIGGIVLVVVGLVFVVIGARDLYQGFSKSKDANVLSASDVEQAVADSALLDTALEPKTGLSYQFPKQWKAEGLEGGGVQYGTLDGVANIRISADDFSGDEVTVTPELYRDSVKQQIDDMQKEQPITYTFLTEGKTTVSELPGYEWTYKLLVNDVPAAGAQVWVVKDNKVMVMTYSALENIYDTFFPTFQAMVQSITQQ